MNAKCSGREWRRYIDGGNDDRVVRVGRLGEAKGKPRQTGFASYDSVAVLQVVFCYKLLGRFCRTVGNNYAGISRKMRVVSPTFAVNVVIPRVCFQPTKLGRCSLGVYI